MDVLLAPEMSRQTLALGGFLLLRVRAGSVFHASQQTKGPTTPSTQTFGLLALPKAVAEGLGRIPGFVSMRLRGVSYWWLWVHDDLCYFPLNPTRCS